MVESRLIKREKGSLPVDVRRSKTSLLKLPSNEEEGAKEELTTKISQVICDVTAGAWGKKF